jgi:hypothetical protein
MAFHGVMFNRPEGMGPPEITQYWWQCWWLGAA